MGKFKVVNGVKLRQYRKALGLSASQVMNVLNKENGWNVCSNALYNWENGSKPIKKYRNGVAEYIERIEQLVRSQNLTIPPFTTNSTKAKVKVKRAYNRKMPVIRKVVDATAKSVNETKVLQLVKKIVIKGIFGTRVEEYYA